MIALSIRRTLFDQDSEVDRVTGIAIPNWDDIPLVKLLRSVDYYEDAAFNYHLLGDVLSEIDHWLAYERERADPEQRSENIELIRGTLKEALDRRWYAVFLSL